MTTFTHLHMRNFKRFAGEHDIPLMGEGQVTLIAAQNGVGKTTILDAMHIVLHGERAFRERYPGIRFRDWLENAYSIEAEAEEYRHIHFSVTLEDPLHGTVQITRTYWLVSEDDGGFSEEIGVVTNGKQLELEAGENRNQFAESWVEALLPRPVTRRFLVDGERLSEFDPRDIDTELIEGLDDLLGIGTLKRLNGHLHTIQRETIRKMVPEDEHQTLDNLLELLDEYETEAAELEQKLTVQQEATAQIKSQVDEFTEFLQNRSKEEGDEMTRLHVDFAIKQSESASMRKQILELMMGPLPFIVAGMPADLEEWKFEAVREALESSKLSDENLRFLHSVLDSVEPALGKVVRARLLTAGDSIAETAVSDGVKSPLSHFDLRTFGELEKRFIELGLDERISVENIIDEALEKVDAFDAVASRLMAVRGASRTAEKAMELKAAVMALSGMEVDCARLKDELESKLAGIATIEEQIEAIHSRADRDSLLNRKHDLLLNLRKVLNRYSVEHRGTMATPLSEAFTEGFQLLSRKADRLESVAIDPETYQTTLCMRGFSGNWLDRDLSATERQHVGLSLVYAFRKVGHQPLPVVIDTPTSRMDRDHKGWSVTRFYPNLSHQVIVLATSDDLGDGLYDELVETGTLGLELKVDEATENSVKVSETNLAVFFGGG